MWEDKDRNNKEVQSFLFLWNAKYWDVTDARLYYLQKEVYGKLSEKVIRVKKKSKKKSKTGQQKKKRRIKRNFQNTKDISIIKKKLPIYDQESGGSLEI